MGTATATAAPLTVQGQQVPDAVVDPVSFAKATRRQTLNMKTLGSFAGFGGVDQFSLLQTGVLSALTVKLSGSLVIALNSSGTVGSTAKWPYDLLKNCKVSVNGQANLINCGGSDLKARDLMNTTELTDRGVPQTIGGSTRYNGSLSLNNEVWGVGQNTSSLSGGTYDVELEYQIPIAMDQVNLVGALFLQTSSTEVAIEFTWASVTDVFTVVSPATVALTAAVIVQGIVYTIPQGSKGEIIIPNLSAFHSMIRSRYPNPGNTLNEIKIVGQGAGRQLMRLWFRTFNGTVGVPLSVNQTNYGQVGWRMGGNDTPEVWPDGHAAAYAAERLYGSDLGTYAGYAVLDFCSTFAIRDSIDEGTATELRFLMEILSGVSLTSPVTEYCKEEIFLGSAGA